MFPLVRLGYLPTTSTHKSHLALHTILYAPNLYTHAKIKDRYHPVKQPKFIISKIYITYKA